MIKFKLVKALMLGLCMSALTSGVAFAQAADTEATIAREELLSEEAKVLYQKQLEVDEALFVTFAKEIEAKGFMVNYTAVSDSFVEIGISPYNDENVSYLNEILGKDAIKVVEFDESILYASSGPLPDASVSDPALENKVYKESTPEEVAEANPEEIFYTTVAEEGQDDTDVQILTSAEASDAVKRGSDEESNGVPAPMMVLAIAGGAALIGGSIIISNKKKTLK